MHLLVTKLDGNFKLCVKHTKRVRIIHVGPNVWGSCMLWCFAHSKPEGASWMDMMADDFLLPSTEPPQRSGQWTEYMQYIIYMCIMCVYMCYWLSPVADQGIWLHRVGNNLHVLSWRHPPHLFMCDVRSRTKSGPCSLRWEKLHLPKWFLWWCDHKVRSSRNDKHSPWAG